MAEEIKRYKGRYTGPQIDDLLGRVPKVEERVTRLENGVSDKHAEFAFYNKESYLCTHNLGKRPAVTVVDGQRNMILADVAYVGDDAVLVSFGMSVTGYVILN